MRPMCMNLVPVLQPAGVDLFLEAAQRLFHPGGEAVAYGVFLLLPAFGLAEYESLLPIRSRNEFDLHLVAHLLPVGVLGQVPLEFFQLAAGVPTRYWPSRLRIAARFASLTMPRSITQTRRAFPYLRSTVRRMTSIVVTSARLPLKTS